MKTKGKSCTLVHSDIWFSNKHNKKSIICLYTKVDMKNSTVAPECSIDCNKMEIFHQRKPPCLGFCYLSIVWLLEVLDIYPTSPWADTCSCKTCHDEDMYPYTRMYRRLSKLQDQNKTLDDQLLGGFTL